MALSVNNRNQLKQPTATYSSTLRPYDDGTVP